MRQVRVGIQQMLCCEEIHAAYEEMALFGAVCHLAEAGCPARSSNPL